MGILLVVGIVLAYMFAPEKPPAPPTSKVTYRAESPKAKSLSPQESVPLPDIPGLPKRATEQKAQDPSIQTDEARHSQQGEPTMKILVANGREDVAQQLVDHMFWRSWKVFALLTGLSMDYYTPLEHRRHSFKEFMGEWINKQFMDQFRDFGLEVPWYWNEHYQKEVNWLHHADHLGVWFWRPTVWWNPDAGVSPQERDWLEEKYPGWNDTFGKYWDVIAENIQPPDLGGALAYMGISPEEAGQDATNYAWAYEPATAGKLLTAR